MISTTTIVPKAFVLDINKPVSKVEMSAATIAALRAIMSGEIKNGMFDMEQRFTDQLDRVVGGMKEALRVETPACHQLEQHILHVEQNSSKKTISQRMLAMTEKLTKQ